MEICGDDGIRSKSNAWTMAQTFFCVHFKKQNNKKNIILPLTTEVSTERVLCFNQYWHLMLIFESGICLMCLHWIAFNEILKFCGFSFIPRQKSNEGCRECTSFAFKNRAQGANWLTYRILWWILPSGFIEQQSICDQITWI